MEAAHLFMGLILQPKPLALNTEPRFIPKEKKNMKSLTGNSNMNTNLVTKLFFRERGTLSTKKPIRVFLD